MSAAHTPGPWQRLQSSGRAVYRTVRNGRAYEVSFNENDGNWSLIDVDACREITSATTATYCRAALASVQS